MLWLPMTYAGTLASQIATAVKAALVAGTCDHKTLRQLVVGPTTSYGYGLLAIYADDRDEDYCKLKDEQIIARLPNAAWLDAVDALPERRPGAVLSLRGFTPPVSDHVDPRVDEGIAVLASQLCNDVRTALRLIAEGQLLGPMDQLVSLREAGYTLSSYADVVAFYHSKSVVPLVPVAETVCGTVNTFYGLAALHDEGVTLFCSERGTVRTSLFADLEAVRFEEGRKVYLRFKGNPTETELEPGHTRHEEWGVPSTQEVGAALLRHFGRPELVVDLTVHPDPALQEVTKRWRQKFAEAKAPAAKVVPKLFRQHGVQAAREFIEWVPCDPDGIALAWLELGDTLVGAGKYEEGLLALERTPHAWRSSRWSRAVPELCALLALGRVDDAVALAAEVAQKGGRTEQSATRDYWAIALAISGKAHEALTLVGDAEEGKAGFARVLALESSDEEAAGRVLRAVLRNDSSCVLGLGYDRYLRSEGLQEIVAQFRRLEAALESSARALTALQLTGRAPTIEVDAASLLEKAEASFRMVREKTREPEKEQAELRAWARNVGRAYAVAGEGGFYQYDVPSLAREHLPSERELTAVAANDAFAYAATGDGLAVFDVSGPSPVFVAAVEALCSSRLDKVALGDGFVALGGYPGAVLFDLGNPAAPRQVGVVGTPLDGTGKRGSGQAVAACGKTLFLSAYGGGLAVLRVDDPAAPTPVAALRLEGLSLSSLTLLGDVLAATDSSKVVLIDVAVPESPRAIGVLPESLAIRALGRRGDQVLGVAEAAIFTIELGNRNRPRAPRVAAAAKIVDATGDWKTCYARGAFVEGDELFVLDEFDDVRVLAAEPLPEAASEDPRPAKLVRALAPALQAWVEHALAQQAAQSVGAVSLFCWGSSVMLRVGPPSSLLTGWDGLGAAFRTELAELHGAPLELDEESASVADAKRQLLQTVRAALPSTAAFRAAASGRVYVLGGESIAEFRDPSRAWEPARACGEGPAAPR